jgi:hypothetical protein
MTADISEGLDARPAAGLRRVVPPLLVLVIGAVIGFGGRSWLASPSDVVVDGHPSTLDVYRFDPTTKASPRGAVIFDQATISKVAAELNGLPAFPRSGRTCEKAGLYVALTFSYDNGDSETVNVRSAPCGMVTKHGDEKVVADALGSRLYGDLAALLPSNP